MCGKKLLHEIIALSDIFMRATSGDFLSASMLELFVILHSWFANTPCPSLRLFWREAPLVVNFEARTLLKGDLQRLVVFYPCFRTWWYQCWS